MIPHGRYSKNFLTVIFRLNKCAIHMNLFAKSPSVILISKSIREEKKEEEKKIENVLIDLAISETV